MKPTVIILTYNSGEYIYRCLNSVKWTDEIIIVDSFSKDNTLEIARSYNAKILEHAFDGYTKQIERGIQQAGNKWILVIDSDEELSPELQDEIKNLNVNDESISGFELNRKVFFLGKWIEHGGWYPDYQFRLFDKTKVKMTTHEIHDSIQPTSGKQKLNGILYHYTYKNLYEYLERINNYTSRAVTDTINSGKKFKWYKLILNPLSTFLRMYFVNKGYKDKMQGFILALYSAIYNLVLYSKLWEYQYSAANKLELPPITVADFKKHKSRV